jgi:hypothetical protein
MSGVDIKLVRSADLSDAEWEQARPHGWERWSRNWMGLRDSPYRSIQHMIRLKYIAYGSRHDQENPFKWDTVVYNLPGSEKYDPTRPWVMKIRTDGNLASEVYIYVDDGRATGHSAEACWAAIRRFASICTKLGIQDATRKRTEPSPTPGPWAGTVVHTNDGEVVGTITTEKWGKTKSLIQELESLLLSSEGMPLRRLLSVRGFLNYVVRTYPWLNPYLKGLHLTIDGWREGKDADGYGLSGKALREFKAAQVVERQLESMAGRREHQAEVELGANTQGQGPDPLAFVKPNARLAYDIKAMKDLTEGDVPARHRYRATDKIHVLYLSGDASGAGFGSAIIGPDQSIMYQSGTWKPEFGNESSNFREAENLVRRIEDMVVEGTGSRAFCVHGQ